MRSTPDARRVVGTGNDRRRCSVQRYPPVEKLTVRIAQFHDLLACGNPRMHLVDLSRVEVFMENPTRFNQLVTEFLG